MSFTGRVVIYGGRGALGSTLISHFKGLNWWVGSIDLSTNEEAHANIIVNPEYTWSDQEEEVVTKMQDILNKEKLDAVICVAGGWAGGNAASKDLVKNSELMWKQSVWTSIIACKVASKYLKEGGLLTLTGAKAAIDATPGMLGYGMAKAAVHQLVRSLSAPKSGLPKQAIALAICPVTLDTPMNRRYMPDADFSSWTPLDYIANLLYKWATNSERPRNGSWVKLITTNYTTEIEEC